jgi:hypothetical protein
MGVVLNDYNAALLDGEIALVCEEGLIMTDEVKVISGVCCWDLGSMGKKIPEGVVNERLDSSRIEAKTSR